jgi:Cohesin domain
MQIKLHTVVPFFILSLLIAGTIVNGVINIASADSQVNQKPAAVGPYSETARIYISPEGVSGISVGQTFTVAVYVLGLDGNNLYGFDILFSWDTSALQYVSHEAKVPMETHPDGVLEEPVTEVKNDVDTVAGVYWLACASISPAEPCNKDGAIFTMTFVLLEQTDNPYEVSHVILANKNGDPIPTEMLVLPQLPSSLTLISDKAEAQHRLGMWRWLQWWIRVNWQHG